MSEHATRRPRIGARVAAALAGLAALVAMAPPATGRAQGPGLERFSGPSSQALHQLFNDYWEWRLAEEPETATRVGRAEHGDRWTDWSAAARERRHRRREEFLLQAMLLSPGTLTPEDRLSAHLLEFELSTRIEAGPYLDLVQRFSQADGAHNEVFSVIDQMPSRTVEDYQRIVRRLEALPVYVDQTIDLGREQLSRGWSQPGIVVDLMLDQVAAQRRYGAGDSPLLAAYRRMPPSLSPAIQSELRARATAAYEQGFLPSWRRLETFLRTEYAPRVRSGLAVGSLPAGPQAYAALIRFYTTTRLSPEAIHQRGLDEVARIQRAIEAIARAEGFTGSASAFERQLSDRPGMRFSGQGEMLDYARDVLARVTPGLPALFRRLPRTPVGVRPIPADREASTASNYTAGTADGSRQAWFNMNTYRPAEQAKYRTDALVLHETVPGHHLQVGLARELQGMPLFRTVFSAAAFSEGWGLYAESLGGALGTVYRDPATRVGQLASEQFRAVRLVVDTGIHAMGWSRDRARTYFAEHVPGQSLAEIDRYIARPGQALAYKLGELAILDLRRKAERELGPRFDVRDFHEAVLRGGSLPLDLLAEQVDAFIAAARVN